MYIHRLTWTLFLSLALSGVACRCGEKSATSAYPSPGAGADSWDPDGNAQSWNRQGFELLLAGLPKSKIDAPLEAIPPTLTWRATSEDPATWFRFVRSREGFQALVDTPLGQELRSQGPWLTIESLRKQVSRLTNFVGGARDDEGLLQGPLAIGTRSVEDDRPSFVIVKRVLPEIQVVARFVAAFASLQMGGPVANANGSVSAEETQDTKPKLSVEKIGAAELHTLHRPGADLHFALFQDLLVFGSDAQLVRQATRVAAGDEKPEQDAHAALWTEQREAGVHIAWRAPSEGPFGLLGVEALGLSLRPDSEIPFTLRLQGGAPPSLQGTQLLRYAPGTTFGAWVDGRKPAQDLLQQARHRVLGAAARDAWEAKKIEEIESTIVAKLEGGIGIWFSLDAANAQNPSPRGVVAFRHADKRALEVSVRALLAGLTDKTVERTVLEPAGNAWLLTTGDDSPAAALTDDALLVALSPGPLRDALHAASGKTRSILDVAQLKSSADASHALYLDLRQGAAFLRIFYRAAFQRRGEPSWDEVAPILEPTFSGLAKGGLLFGELKAARAQVFAGGIHALP